MALPGRPAGASDHAIRIEVDRLLPMLDALPNAELVAAVGDLIDQARGLLATGDDLHTLAVTHRDARLTLHCLGEPLGLYFRGRFSQDRAGRMAFEALMAEDSGG